MLSDIIRRTNSTQIVKHMCLEGVWGLRLRNKRETYVWGLRPHNSVSVLLHDLSPQTPFQTQLLYKSDILIYLLFGLSGGVTLS